jgi:hypothetical protein
MKRVAVLQSNYIPWKGYFDIIAAVDEFIIYDCVQYTKNDWRNRNRIKTPAGSTWLTVPVRQRSLAQTIEQTEIADPGCFRRHWATFRQFYAKARNIDYCTRAFEDIFLGTPPRYLGEANVALIRRACEVLGIDTPIRNATTSSLREGRNERLLDVCLQSGATTYLSGSAARAYLDVQAFDEAGIAVEWMAYDGYPEYPQPHPPFDHFVSVLDLIACTGETAAECMLHAGIRK